MIAIEPALIVTRSTEEAAASLAGSTAPVVVIPLMNAYEDAARCLDSVFRWAPADAGFLVVDDGGEDRRALDLIEDRHRSGGLRHYVVVLGHASTQGYVSSMNDAFTAAAGRDVVALNSDVIVSAEWFERLRAAAYADAATASASALTNHGTILSVPRRNHPATALPVGLTIDEAAARVAAASRQLRPRIPTAVGHCVYLKRTAFDRVGGFDMAFSPGYGEEVDWSQRAIAAGLHHVAADDVFVFHRGSASFGQGTMTAMRTAHDAILRARYRKYDRIVSESASDPYSPLAASIAIARRALVGATVLVDARTGAGVDDPLVTHIVGSLSGRPGIARVEVVTAADDQSATADRLRGQVDIVCQTKPAADRADAIWAAGLGAPLVTVPNLDTEDCARSGAALMELFDRVWTQPARPAGPVDSARHAIRRLLS